MSQINTFFVPLADDGAAQQELNAFLRGHRVLQIEKAFAGNGWAFCVEWLEAVTDCLPSPLTESNKTIYNIDNEDHIGHTRCVVPRVQGEDGDKRRKDAQRRYFVYSGLQCRGVAARCRSDGAAECAAAKREAGFAGMGWNRRAVYNKVS